MNGASALKERYVKKHNAAIRSYSDMSLLQRKLANTLLYNAYHELPSKDFHEITISKLLTLLSMRTNDYQKLKKTIIQLMSTVIEWNVIKKTEKKQDSVDVLAINSEESWRACTLLSSVQIEGTTIKYEYSQVLKELFYQPSFYSKISLNVQNKFKSLYSLALYENCLSYLNCGSSGWISFEMFRKIMGVNEKQYKTFRDFSRRVLKPAIQEVNKNSDISVDCEIRKARRIPSQIKFVVSKNKEQFLSLSHDAEADDLLKHKLRTYGFFDKETDTLVQQHGKEKILEKIALVENSKTNIKVPIAFLKAALKEDYKKNETKKRPLKEVYLEQKFFEQEREALEKKYKLYVDEIYKNWLTQLKQDEVIYLLDQVTEYHNSSNFPFWKRAKLKINTEGQFFDLDLFLCIKIFLMNTKEDLEFSNALPTVCSFNEYKQNIRCVASA